MPMSSPYEGEGDFPEIPPGKIALELPGLVPAVKMLAQCCEDPTPGINAKPSEPETRVAEIYCESCDQIIGSIYIDFRES